MTRFNVKDYIVVSNPIRIYKITAADKNGYHATYVGPGTQSIDNALVLISYEIANKEHHVRLATPAEVILYVKKPATYLPLLIPKT
jgi:hypothetical protein